MKTCGNLVERLRLSKNLSKLVVHMIQGRGWMIIVESPPIVRFWDLKWISRVNPLMRPSNFVALLVLLPKWMAITKRMMPFLSLKTPYPHWAWVALSSIMKNQLDKPLGGPCP